MACVGLVCVGVDGGDAGAHLLVVVSLSGDGIGVGVVVSMILAVEVVERSSLFRVRLIYVGMNKTFNGLFTTDVGFRSTLAEKGNHSLPCDLEHVLPSDTPICCCPT